MTNAKPAHGTQVENPCAQRGLPRYPQKKQMMNHNENLDKHETKYKHAREIICIAMAAVFLFEMSYSLSDSIVSIDTISIYSSLLELMGKEFTVYFIYFYSELGRVISAFITGILISAMFRKNQITYGCSLIFIEYLFFFYIELDFINKDRSLYITFITLLLSLFSSMIAIIYGIKVISFISKKMGLPRKKLVVSHHWLLAITLINLFLLSIVADIYIINMYIAAVCFIICVLSLMRNRYQNKVNFLLIILSIVINLFVIAGCYQILSKYGCMNI